MYKRLLVMVLFGALYVHSNDNGLGGQEEYAHLDPEAARLLRQFDADLAAEGLNGRGMPIDESREEEYVYVLSEQELARLLPDASPTRLRNLQSRRMTEQRAFQHLQSRISREVLGEELARLLPDPRPSRRTNLQRRRRTEHEQRAAFLAQQQRNLQQQVPQQISEEERERQLAPLDPGCRAWLRNNNFTDRNPPSIQELMELIISFIRFVESVTPETDLGPFGCTMHFADLIDHMYASPHKFSETVRTAIDLQPIYDEIKHCEGIFDLNFRLRPRSRSENEILTIKYVLDTLKFFVYLKAKKPDETLTPEEKESDITLASIIERELTEGDFNSVIKDFTEYTIDDLGGRKTWIVGMIHLGARKYWEMICALVKAADREAETRRRGRR